MRVWAVLFAAVLVGCTPGGISPSYAVRDWDPVLTKHALALSTEIAALDADFKATGLYPNAPTYVLPEHFYTSSGSSYRLGVKLGWDPALWYEPAVGWTFEPGDGSPEIPVKLKAP